MRAHGAFIDRAGATEAAPNAALPATAAANTVDKSFLPAYAI
jgi:hypothetical protein